MNTLDAIGKTVLQQHEGNQQLAAVLARVTRASMRRRGRFLARALRNFPSEHSLP